MCTVKPHIIVLTETWLDTNTDEVFYSIDGYNVYRSDRSGLSSARSGGGGTLIAVCKSLVSVPVVVVEDGVEHLFIIVSNRAAKFIVGATYISQEWSIDKYKIHVMVAESG